MGDAYANGFPTGAEIAVNERRSNLDLHHSSHGYARKEAF